MSIKQISTKKKKDEELLSAQDLIFLKRVARSRKTVLEKMKAALSYGTEKRFYPRFKKHLDLSFRKMDSMARHFQGTTKDLSLGGFRMDLCCLGKPPCVDDVIEVTLKDSESRKPVAVHAIGRIVWVKAKEDEEAYEIGVKITYINSEDRQKFLNCLGKDY